MHRPSGWSHRAVFALCLTLLCVCALGELVHDHRGCPLDSSLGCSSCALASLSVVLPPALTLTMSAAPGRHGWIADELLLPACVPLGRPTARGPPAC